METEVDTIEGKASIFSQENPLYGNNMKLYEAERYDFQHSGESSADMVTFRYDSKCCVFLEYFILINYDIQWSDIS